MHISTIACSQAYIQGVDSGVEGWPPKTCLAPPEAVFSAVYVGIFLKNMGILNKLLIVSPVKDGHGALFFRTGVLE